MTQLEINMAEPPPVARPVARYVFVSRHHRRQQPDGTWAEWIHFPSCFSCQGTGYYYGTDRAACPCGDWADQRHSAQPGTDAAASGQGTVTT
jgi:hypothetical protein